MSKPKIYAKCPAGCKWEVPHKSDLEDTNNRLDQLTSVAYVTASAGTAMGSPALTLVSDVINENSFIEVFPANVTAREYIYDCLSTTLSPMVQGNTVTIFVKETSTGDTLNYIIKTTYLESGSQVYIHF